MTIHQLKEHLSQRLAGIYSAGESDFLHRHLVSHCCEIDFAQVRFCGEMVMTDQQRAEYLDFAKRLSHNEPLQYVLGYTEFYGLRLAVRPGVLIPRPETEELVHHIVQLTGSKRVKILDIGTGSGCIAAALASNCPNADVHAADISADALAIASENALANKLKITFSHIDILDWQETADCLADWDIIVSNPPYIRIEEQKLMHANVLNHEPYLALFVSDEDPLIFYRSIAQYGQQSLRSGGQLFFEINEQLAKETADMLGRKGFQNIQIFQDLQGKDRWISCIR